MIVLTVDGAAYRAQCLRTRICRIMTRSRVRRWRSRISRFMRWRCVPLVLFPLFALLSSMLYAWVSGYGFCDLSGSGVFMWFSAMVSWLSWSRSAVRSLWRSFHGVAFERSCRSCGHGHGLAVVMVSPCFEPSNMRT